MKASPDLLARFADLLDVVPDVDRKLVFGCPACLVGGRMFFGVHATGLFVRLPPVAAAELLAAGGTAFEPMAGRTMGGFFILPAGLPEQAQWVRRSHDHTLALPPKRPGGPTTGGRDTADPGHRRAATTRPRMRSGS